ncbi:MAG: DUF3786 domain-containing protein [Clostridiales bacterium]|jgi:hypothetical protein|nr:DUF3786 domain-containing protein [Eubacteriales bacterium]MDH7565107.1 DUF3786 domain-containing protein [Clostridiales bacterium]
MYDYMKGPSQEGAYSPAFTASRERLRQLDPLEISQNTLCRYDSIKKSFSVESFGQLFDIFYPHGDVQFSGHEGLRPPIGWRLLLLNYLSAAKNIPLAGQWISYKDQPNGSVFYPSIKKNQIDPMGNFYNTCNKEALLTALAQVGFSVVPGKADITAQAWHAPRIPVRVQFWDGDEEVPGAFQILFDSSIAGQMHIEDSAGLCELINYLIMSQYKLVLENENKKCHF